MPIQSIQYPVCIESIVEQLIMPSLFLYVALVFM